MDGWIYFQFFLINWWVFDLLVVQLVGKIVDFFFIVKFDKGIYMWIKKVDNNDYLFYKIFFYVFGDLLVSFNNIMLY